MNKNHDTVGVGSVIVEGLKVYAHHGVYRQENVVGNYFEVDVRLDFDADVAMRTDSPDQTLNYAVVVDIIKDCMSRPAQLLEHVVYVIHNELTRRFPEIISGSIAVYKIQPPLSAEMKRVGYVYRW